MALAGRREQALEGTRALMREPADAIVCATDVTDKSSVDALFAHVVSSFGHLDLLFNNAGISAPAVPIDLVEECDWRAVINANLTGAFLVAQSAFGTMKAQDPRGGRIINNGSIAATVPRPNSVAYACSKHGVLGLTKALSLEGRALDIACGQIDIGNAASEMGSKAAKGMLQADGSIAEEQLMDVSQVARAVIYMDSLPLEANVQFLTVMATKMPFIGRG